jgi:hypothetical protein
MLKQCMLDNAVECITNWGSKVVPDQEHLLENQQATQTQNQKWMEIIELL